MARVFQYFMLINAGKTVKRRSTHPSLSLLFGILLAWHNPAEAQVIKIDSTSHWKKSFKFGLNLNQAAFTSNWKAGGVNSLGYNSLLNYKANYKNGKHSWDNELDFLYGSVNNQGQGNRKTMDRIFLDTKYGHSLNAKWDWIISANLQSQFGAGFKYDTDTAGVTQTLISDFFAPAFITAALGFEYHPVDYFKLRLSPIAPRVTIVNDPQRFVTVDNPKPYGVDPTRTTRFEWFAFQMLAEFNKDIAKNMNLKWRYVLFLNYQTPELKKIDHRLDVNLVAKVNKFINVSLGGILLYDYDQGTKVQLSQAFSLVCCIRSRITQKRNKGGKCIWPRSRFILGISCIISIQLFFKKHKRLSGYFFARTFYFSNRNLENDDYVLIGNNA